MALSRIGLVGWRGMVGSVLMERFVEENDLNGLEVTFFSTSQAGQMSPSWPGISSSVLADANDIKKLSEQEVIITCQGGKYTEAVLPQLRSGGWQGYWIDAASTKRMDDDSVIILDPVNLKVIEHALLSGIKNYIGGNCTVSLMLMGVGGLFLEGLVEWMSTMTYQSASGAGAQAMRTLAHQMHHLGQIYAQNDGVEIGALEHQLTAAVRTEDFPVEAIGYPLASSLIPWIDREVGPGESREEWKGYVETNKILGASTPIPVDGICVRVAAFRCHSQALTMKLNKNVPLDEISDIIANANPWSVVVPNTKEETSAKLTPAAVTGKLDIPVGRLRKLRMGPEYLGAFTVGDQLLWGAAEPLRRMLVILRAHLG